MKSSQLALLLRTLNGDAATVAHHHIFQQNKLEQDDHTFLEQHLDELGASLLSTWLRFRPARPAPIVDRLMADWPSGDDGALSVVFSPFEGFAKDIEPAVLDDIVDRLRPPHIETWPWWHAAKHLAAHYKPTCPAFAASLQRQEDCHLALALFDVRREPAKVPAALREAVRAGSFEERSRLLASIARLGLLERIAPADALPEEVTFAFEDNRHGDQDHPGQRFIDIARRWPGECSAEARTWLVRQIVAAAARGADWWQLWYEAPADLRNRAALEAANAGVRAPWILFAIRESLERREAGAWDLLFGYLDTPGALDLQHGPPRRMLGRSDPKGPFSDRREDLGDLMAPSELAGRLLVEAPLPEDHDDAFEERLLGYRGRFDEAPIGNPFVVRIGLFRRLAALPLTRARANRLIGLLVEHHFHPFMFDPERDRLGFLVELFAAADPQPPERLPPLSIFTDRPNTTEGIAAFRQIAGAAAEEPLRAFFREPFDALDAETEATSWSQHLDEALHRVVALPDLVTDELRDQIVNRVRTLPLRVLIDIYQHYGEELPWLVEGGEAAIAKRANEQAERTDERWIFSSVYDVKGDHLPTYLRPAIERRVRFVQGERELLGLLRWLGEQGDNPATLVPIFLDWLTRGEMSQASITWLATILSSRTRWDDLGPTILGALFDRKQLGHIVALAERCIPPESAGPDEQKRRQSLIAATHEALARVLLGRAREALEGAEPRTSIPLLHALTALHPRSALVKKVHALGKAPGADQDVLDLIDLNEQLLKHDTTREARLSDLRMALSLFADAIRRNREAAA